MARRDEGDRRDLRIPDKQGRIISSEVVLDTLAWIVIPLSILSFLAYWGTFVAPTLRQRSVIAGLHALWRGTPDAARLPLARPEETGAPSLVFALVRPKLAFQAGLERARELVAALPGARDYPPKELRELLERAERACVDAAVAYSATSTFDVPWGSRSTPCTTCGGYYDASKWGPGQLGGYACLAIFCRKCLDVRFERLVTRVV